MIHVLFGQDDAAEPVAQAHRPSERRELVARRTTISSVLSGMAF